MRAAFRRRGREDEEESVFVSMTDMTVSFLFILMIMLAFFASQFNPQDSVTRVEFDSVVAERNRLQKELTEAREQIAELQAKVEELEAEIERLKAELAQKDPVEEYLKRTAMVRQRILEQLRDQLRVDFPDLLIEISQEQDALRFQGDGLFDSGQAVLAPDKRRIVETIASRLEQILPCYTLGTSARWSLDCNDSAAIIEAVQIEGHTDSTGDDRLNLDLSTQRANETFWAMLEREPNLNRHLNFRDQPVLSVAGYGEMRPIAENDTAAGRSTNRRIDLRIIMYTPTVSSEIDEIGRRLGAVPSGATPP
jgi:outer membrane protein OmpA-like peptidoglycan-associated protein